MCERKELTAWLNVIISTSYNTVYTSTHTIVGYGLQCQSRKLKSCFRRLDLDNRKQSEIYN